MRLLFLFFCPFIFIIISMFISYISQLTFFLQMSVPTSDGKILNYIQSSGLYKEKALNEWSKLDIADPWLIATAYVYNLTIITFEKANGDFDINHKSSKCKIPT